MSSILWPKSLQEKITSIGSLKEPNLYFSLMTKVSQIENNSEKAVFLQTFLPDIKAIGYDLQREASDHKWYTGMQYTLSESLDKKRRVLQVLLVWTKQRAFMSQFFTIIFFLVSLLSILQISSVKPESLVWGEWSIALITLFLLIFSFYYVFTSILLWHLNARLLIGIAAIFYYFLSYFDLNEKLDGNGLLFALTSDGIELYVSLTSILFISFAVFLIILRLLEIKGILNFINHIPMVSLGHDMDYAPIWVFLEKKLDIESLKENEPFNWQVEKIIYDRTHYYVGSVDSEDSKHDFIFEIRNAWHSFNISVFTSLFSKKIKTVLISAEVIVLGVFSALLWGEDYLIFLQTIIGIIVIISIVSLYNGFEFNFNQNFEENSNPENPNNILTPTKIDILWNLKSEKARLKITHKLANPFNSEWDKGTWEKESTNILLYILRKYLFFALSDFFVKTLLLSQSLKKKLV